MLREEPIFVEFKTQSGLPRVYVWWLVRHNVPSLLRRLAFTSGFERFVLHGVPVSVPVCRWEELRRELICNPFCECVNDCCGFESLCCLYFFFCRLAFVFVIDRHDRARRGGWPSMIGQILTVTS